MLTQTWRILPDRYPIQVFGGWAAERWGAKPVLAFVRVACRSISPPWRSIRFRLALRTYAPWGVRVVSQTKSRKIPTRKRLPLFFASRPSHRGPSSRSSPRPAPASPSPYASWAVQFHPHGVSIRFRLAPRTYASRGCIVRVVSLIKPRKFPTLTILPLSP